jgi:hypothetical protein
MEKVDRGVRSVVLVEGASDRAAVEALARRGGRDLAAEGVAVVAMGGATVIGAALARFAAEGRQVSGLCDAGEERAFVRALERAGFGSALTRMDLERLGFFVCVADLEDELIRAIGPDAVERVVAAEGELPSFRRFQKQPAQRGRPIDAQLRRFLGTHSGRKIRYGQLLVDALPLDRVPRPLEQLLACV